MREMKYILAVSGGVDSVVLLDLLAKSGKYDLMVAHFDHGIRESSSSDARFVEALAEKYGLPFEMKREELGEKASEDFARSRRYDFLFGLANKYQAKVVTAHHQDDIVETMVINLMRGTRWRGIAGMSDERIIRPFAKYTKQDIYKYALRHHLEWCEDETNASDKYARNNVRRKIGLMLDDITKRELMEIWKNQLQVRREIELEGSSFDDLMTSRYFLINIPLFVSEELLYQSVLKKTGTSLLSSQIERLMVAVRTGRAGTKRQIASHVEVKLPQKTVTIHRVD